MSRCTHIFQADSAMPNATACSSSCCKAQAFPPLRFMDFCSFGQTMPPRPGMTWRRDDDVSGCGVANAELHHNLCSSNRECLGAVPLQLCANAHWLISWQFEAQVDPLWELHSHTRKYYMAFNITLVLSLLLLIILYGLGK